LLEQVWGNFINEVRAVLEASGQREAEIRTVLAELHESDYNQIYQ
jgi:hypothetical protein